MNINIVTLIIAIWGVLGWIVIVKLEDKKVGKITNIVLPILLGPLYWIAILVNLPFVIDHNKTSGERPVNLFMWNNY